MRNKILNDTWDSWSAVYSHGNAQQFEAKPVKLLPKLATANVLAALEIMLTTILL